MKPSKTTLTTTTPKPRKLFALMPIRLGAGILIDKGQIDPSIIFAGDDLAFLLAGGYVSEGDPTRNPINNPINNSTEESL